MITGELKNKVDKIWEIFWTGGLANPLDVIEQLTYLMFVRDLDQIDQTRQRESLMLSIPHKNNLMQLNISLLGYKREMRNINAAGILNPLQEKVRYMLRFLTSLKREQLMRQYLFINPLKTCTKSCRQKCFLLSSN